MKKSQLTFYKKPGEFAGLLILTDYKGEEHRFNARSGLADYQKSYWMTGCSPIPPSDAIRGEYEVRLPWVEPYNWQKASMGSRFYAIEPNVIYSKDGSKARSGIGIHDDANWRVAPGSAGCIALMPGEMDRFNRAMDAEYNAGLDFIPLTVIYAENLPARKKKHWAQASYDRIKETGLVTSPERDFDSPVKWGEFAVILERLNQKKGGK